MTYRWKLVAAAVALSVAGAAGAAVPAMAQSVGVTVHTGPSHHVVHDRVVVRHPVVVHRNVVVRRGPVVVHRGCRTVVSTRYYNHRRVTVRRQVC